jgi:hypothetical protein
MKIILKMVFQADPVNDQKRSAERELSAKHVGQLAQDSCSIPRYLVT